MPAPSYANIGLPHTDPPALHDAPFVVVTYRMGGGRPVCSAFTAERYARTYAERCQAEAIVTHAEVCTHDEFATLRASWEERGALDPGETPRQVQPMKAHPAHDGASTSQVSQSGRPARQLRLL